MISSSSSQTMATVMSLDADFCTFSSRSSSSLSAPLNTPTTALLANVDKAQGTKLADREPTSVSTYEEQQSLWFASILTALVLAIMVNLGMWLERDRPLQEWHFRTPTLAFGYFLIAYHSCVVYARYQARGMAGAYDSFWACNVSLLLVALGIFYRVPSLLGVPLTLLAFEHTTFAFDVVSYLVTGKFIVGSAAYLAYPTTSKLEYLTTTHHLWFVPSCLFVLYKSGGILEHCLPLSILFTGMLITMARLGTPKYSRLPSGKPHLLNINMSYGFAEDVRLAFAHMCDDSPFPVLLAFLLFLHLVVNGPSFLALRAFSTAFLQ